jgi:A/G-specific adenine glycosylase
MDLKNDLKLFFRNNLLKWHQEVNERDYPWKGETDPYKIWLSEIILQQTRSDQGLPYYQRFIERFPDVYQLAQAPEDEIFRLWQGLGYYSRCRNLIKAAAFICNERSGIFPTSYESLLSLPGVGPYTAAAIASFAFNQPHAVIDGNVYRVLARFLGLETATNSREGKQLFQSRAYQLLDEKNPAGYNQAIMDFGASVCKPQQPGCAQCPLSKKCIALKENTVALLPIKKKAIKLRERHFHYFLLRCGESLYICQRTGNDIWRHLYELYQVEEQEQVCNTTAWEKIKPFVRHQELTVMQHKQRLTHQIIRSEFHILELDSRPEYLNQGLWVAEKSLAHFAFPKTILSFLNRITYF